MSSYGRNPNIPNYIGVNVDTGNLQRGELRSSDKFFDRRFRPIDSWIVNVVIVKRRAAMSLMIVSQTRCAFAEQADAFVKHFFALITERLLSPDNKRPPDPEPQQNDASFSARFRISTFSPNKWCPLFSPSKWGCSGTATMFLWGRDEDVVGGRPVAWLLPTNFKLFPLAPSNAGYRCGTRIAAARGPEELAGEDLWIGC